MRGVGRRIRSRERQRRRRSFAGMRMRRKPQFEPQDDGTVRAYAARRLPLRAGDARDPLGRLSALFAEIEAWDLVVERVELPPEDLRWLVDNGRAALDDGGTRIWTADLRPNPRIPGPRVVSEPIGP